MSDYGILREELARQQIDERVARRQESRVQGRTPPGKRRQTRVRWKLA